jgi:hypothetical protein
MDDGGDDAVGSTPTPATQEFQDAMCPTSMYIKVRDQVHHPLIVTYIPLLFGAIEQK